MFVKFLIKLFVQLRKTGVVFDTKLYLFLFVDDTHGEALDAANVSVVV